jgi:hypothetical protein
MTSRIEHLAQHLAVSRTSAASAASTGVGENMANAVPPPTVLDPGNQMAKDPVHFLIEKGREHPACVLLARLFSSSGRKS